MFVLKQELTETRNVWQYANWYDGNESSEIQVVLL